MKVKRTMFLRAAVVCVVVCVVLLGLGKTLVKTEEQFCSIGLTNPKCKQKPHSLYQEEVDSVSYELLKQRLTAGNLQLFDVREPDEFKEGVIPGATNIPLSEVQQAFTLTPDQFTQLYGVPMPEKHSSDVMLYCQRGRRSLTALHTVHTLGYSRARHYVGGYSEWLERESQ
ncbi:thiosulfate sulfurtransferase/rhodanese-like domain-containing protein 1 isoform X1 [Ictalurus punctatus]|uniref:Thiosulfate sulfurtransferase/rhodanese-like domain-containing protein 1 isoform X1 n=1 Tax=Ictalurus punctatus TaxID=7998 RepID=A0A9F7RAR5_ICTPU|nr:thiosulfate sulfurtransferase/rhodanese-like domain-containing protein 1 isoform X1 [Ictalurus punctatus]